MMPRFVSSVTLESRSLATSARALRRCRMTEGEDEVIFFDPDSLMDLVSKAPSTVTLYGRGEGREVIVGGRNVGICTTGGTPNFSDMKNGRRPARWPLWMTSAE